LLNTAFPFRDVEFVPKVVVPVEWVTGPARNPLTAVAAVELGPYASTPPVVLPFPNPIPPAESVMRKNPPAVVDDAELPPVTKSTRFPLPNAIFPPTVRVPFEAVFVKFKLFPIVAVPGTLSVVLAVIVGDTMLVVAFSVLTVAAAFIAAIVGPFTVNPP